jgi:hypothetical protein
MERQGPTRIATGGGRDPSASIWVLAAAILATSTAIFNVRTVAHIDQPPTAPKVAERCKELISYPDTDQFLQHLELSARALRKGRIHFPVSDFDCPVSYLVAAGLALCVTGWSPLVTHNVFYLVVFFFNGLAAFAFLRSLVRSTSLALLGSLAYQCCNYIFMSYYLGHMNCLQIQWIPLAFLAAWRLVEGAVDGRARASPGSGGGPAEPLREGIARPDEPSRGVWWGPLGLLGVAMGMQVLSSPYYTEFLAFVALPAFLVGYGLSARRASGFPARAALTIAAQFLAAAVVAGVISGFYLLPRLGFPSTTYPPQWYRPYVLDHYIELLDPGDPALFVGLPMFVLAVLSLRWWFYHARPLTSALVLTMVVALAMMVPAIPGTPYWIVYHIAPMFKHMRVPLRLFPIFFLMLIALNVVYLDTVGRGLSAYRRRGLIALVFCSVIGLNWMASPWVLNFDLVSLTKGLLGLPQGSIEEPASRTKAARGDRPSSA